MVEKSALEKLVQEGLSSREISREFNLSQTTVRYWLNKYNLKLAPGKGGKPRTAREHHCLNCSKVLQSKDSRAKYCCVDCSAKYKQKLYIDAWLNGDVDGQISGGTLLSGYIRHFLLDQSNYQCSQCGWSQINPFTQKVPLEINHIDGNFLNNSPSNLEVLCPNCHALKHTYQNRGQGRRAKGFIR